MKIAAFILTTTACLAAAVVLFFGMIVGMNGYNGSDAEYGLATYVALAALISILAGGGSSVLFGKLTTREFGPFVSLLIAVLTLTIVAAVLEFAAVIAGVLVSEFLRTHR